MNDENKKLKINDRVDCWFAEHGHLINKTAWDIELDLPLGTVQKHIKHGVKMNYDRIKKTHKLIKKLMRINNNFYK